MRRSVQTTPPPHIPMFTQLTTSLFLSGALICSAMAAGPIAQQAYVQGSNTEQYDQCGSSVAISGDTLVVGAPQEDSAATGVNGNQNDNNMPDSVAAYVLVRSGNTWTQQ